MLASADGRTPSVSALFRTSTGILALALLAVELVAGIQSYVTSTIVPLMASDLHAQGEYGLVNGAGQVAMFLTMPLGTYLLARFAAGRLLTWFTLLTLAGAIVSAIAPTIDIFIVGRALVGLASGALATIGMGVIVTHLPRSWRQLVLAGFAAMWVITSLLGPLYASWVSALLGWRWALLLYLPLLIVARLLVARRLPRTALNADRSRLDATSAVMLAGGIALMSMVASVGAWWPVFGAAGSIFTAIAAHRLLPRGTFRLHAGQPSAVALLGVLCGIYFGASSIVAILGHEVLNFGPVRIGILLTSGGLGWAILGLICGRFPATTDASFARRTRSGSALLLTGLLAMAAAILWPSGWLGMTLLMLGWVIAGVGMGLGYLSTLTRIVETPPHPDGIGAPEAAAATVIVETIVTAILTSAATAAASAVLIANNNVAPAGIFLVLALGAALMFLLIPRVTRSATETVR